MIFGYRNLIIDIYFSAVTGLCYVDLKHTEIIKEDQCKGVKPDNIFEKLTPWLPKNFCTDKHIYIEQLKREKKTVSYGTTITTFRIQDSGFAAFKNYFYSRSFLGSGTTRNFKINFMTHKSREFLAFHEKFQMFIIFFIDAANFIDLSDSKWMFFYLYVFLIIYR